MERLTPQQRAQKLLMRARVDEIRQRHGLKPVSFPPIRDEEKSLIERIMG
jgi:hypothetical protein